MNCLSEEILYDALQWQASHRHASMWNETDKETAASKTVISIYRSKNIPAYLSPTVLREQVKK